MSKCKCGKIGKILLRKEVSNTDLLYMGIGQPITKEALDCCDIEVGVLIDDRGYLRLVDTGDYQCLDHGHNVEIAYCPFCGADIRKPEPGVVIRKSGGTWVARYEGVESCQEAQNVDR